MKPAIAVSPRAPAKRIRGHAELLCAVLCTFGVLMVGPVSAADRVKLSDAQATYRADRAACLSGKTNQDRDTCLREAGAALQEARRGGLDNARGEFETNRLARCDSQPPEDRALCVRRMNGEGFTSGSVAGGGIYRELSVPEVPVPPTTPHD